MEGEANTWLLLLDKFIIPLLFLVLTPLVTALANRAIAALKEKTKLELTKQQEEALHRMLEEAIDFAEEQAHKAAKQDDKLDGDSKMAKALEYIETKSKVLNLDDVAEARSEELAALVEAKLFPKRKRAE